MLVVFVGADGVSVLARSVLSPGEYGADPHPRIDLVDAVQREATVADDGSRNLSRVFDHKVQDLGIGVRLIN